MRKLFSYAAALSFICLLAACSKKMVFARSVIVPAAEGRVKIKHDQNNNYAINVTVNQLADPKNLQPPRETYVVWMESKDKGIKNLGRLKSSSGLFSKGLKASLSAVTSFKPVRFFITAEESGDVLQPGPQTILITQ
jgi:hypothetical protein